MPKSFGNKSFITPPTAVKLLGDAGDLADLQEATAHMTVMNRMTSGLQQATRRVVLSSGATATLRRAFGQETITLDRSSISSTEDACIPYVESGRQRWETGAIDISDDLLGICNGPPCPAAPIQDGSISASFALDDAVKVRKYAPPSAFSRSLWPFLQAVYGTKRTDISYASDGHVTIDGVTFGHTYYHSSQLYTDDGGGYWVLHLNTLASATIQSWKPCRGITVGSGDVAKAYRLSTLKANREAVEIPCSGAVYAAGYSITNGWHATKRGDIGHIVLHEGANGEFQGPKLCKYVLSDLGVAQNEGEPWAGYLARRFSITFSIEEQAIDTPVAIAIVGPTTSEEEAAQGKLMLLDIAAPSVARQQQTVANAPLYCRYTDDDTLDVVRFSQYVGQNNQIARPDRVCDDCATNVVNVGGRFACLSFGDVTSFSSEADLGTISIQEGYHFQHAIMDFDDDWGTTLSEYETDMLWTVAWQIGPQPITDDCGHSANWFICYFWQWTNIGDFFSKKHVLIFPEGSHESFLILELEAHRKNALTNGCIQNEIGYKDWVHYTRRLYYFPDDAEAEKLDEIEFEEGEDWESAFDCIRGVGDVHITLTPFEETDIYNDKALGQYLDLLPFKWPDPIYVDGLVDRESFYLHHRNSWFVPDKSIERHDGYDAFVDDGCFVGKS